MKAKKIFIFQIIIFIILFVIIESSSRIFITRREFNGLAIKEMINKLNLLIYKSNYKKNNGIIQKQKCIDKKILEEYNINKENNLIKNLKQKYEYGFSNFIKTATNNSKPKILLVYLPLIENNNNFQNKFSEYFKKLSANNKVKFVDLTDSLVDSGGIEDWSLLPKNSHFSRYGNKIIANELKPILEELLPKYQYDKKNISNKKIKAGLNRNKNLLWNIEPSMVYRVKTNSNGFRNTEEISDNLIVGVYGGSYTFGPYLPNHDTFPSILEYKIRNNNQERFQKLQVLNAGLAGTNIFHQIQLLEQTKSTNLDFIIIQVSDRDIYAVSSSYMKVVGPIKINDDSLFLPSPVEKQIYKNCGIKFKK